MQIFLSYAREDLPAATRLYQELREAGLTVWFDRESLQPGARWKYAISTAIRNSRYFIVLLSVSSSSKTGFVQAEVKQALTVLDEYPETESYVIPVRIEESTPSHPRLNELQWVDLFPNWRDGLDKLLRFFTEKDSATYISTRDSEVVSQNEAQVRGSRKLLFNGMYQSSRSGRGKGKWYHYVRFFQDSTVIAVSSTGTPRDLTKWFTRDFMRNNDGASGKFALEGSLIRFSSTSSYGTVDFEGEVLANSLILRSHSHINGYRGVSEYKFRELEEE